jgi:hypothetical protein
MWKPWRKVLEPWRTIPGWEFDLLRKLPADVATRLYRMASMYAGQELRRTWQFWAFFGLFGGTFMLTGPIVWIVAANMGLRPSAGLPWSSSFTPLSACSCFIR